MYVIESGNKWAIVRYSKQWGFNLKESKDVESEVQESTFPAGAQHPSWV